MTEVIPLLRMIEVILRSGMYKKCDESNIYKSSFSIPNNINVNALRAKIIRTVFILKIITRSIEESCLIIYANL